MVENVHAPVSYTYVKVATVGMFVAAIVMITCCCPINAPLIRSTRLSNEFFLTPAISNASIACIQAHPGITATIRPIRTETHTVISKSKHLSRSKRNDAALIVSKILHK